MRLCSNSPKRRRLNTTQFVCAKGVFCKSFSNLKGESLDDFSGFPLNFFLHNIQSNRNNHDV